METTRRQVGDVIVVSVAARALGPGNAKDLERQLTDLLGPDMKVVIDLGRVESIDGSGCGAILSWNRRLIRHGGHMKVCGISPSVRLPLQLVGMHRRMEVFNNEAEAVKAFQL